MSEEHLSAEGEESLLGLQVGNWKLVRKLGEGGMAVVYLGIHQFLPKIGAVKVLRREFAKNQNVVERFRREALAADSLNHPNIIHVEDFGRDPEHDFFMVLEYLLGSDLESFCDEAPFALGWVLGVMKQVCAGLEKTHSAGIIHRDLKPSNIFLMSGEKRIPTIKILDFGIAKAEQQFDKKLTRTGSIVGTPAYLAPEQLKPKQYELKQTVDIYAIGVILYQLLTGRLPIERDSFFEYLMATFTEVPRKIGVLRPELAGSALEALVARLLEKRPEDRPQSMDEVWRLLEDAAIDLQDPLDRAGKFPAPSRYRQKPVTYEQLRTQAEHDQKRKQQTALREKTHVYSEEERMENELPSGQLVLPADKNSESEENTFDTYVDQSFLKKDQAPKSILSWWPLLLILLLGSVGGVWWKGTQSSTSKKPAVVVRKSPPPARRDSLAFLDKLFNKGVQAIKKQQYQEAVRRWKQITKVKGWKKSRYYPSLYAGIGDSLAKQKRLHSAKTFYKRYLKEAKKFAERKVKAGQRGSFAKQLKRAETKAKTIQGTVLPALAASISKSESRSQKAFSVVQRNLKRKRWKSAFQAFQKFEKEALDSSALQMKMATLLSPQFPSLSYSLLNRALKDVELSEKEKKRLSSQRSFVLEALKKRKQQLQKAFEAIREQLRRKKFRRTRKAIRKLVKTYTLMALSSPDYMELINDTLPQSIREGIWIAKYYKSSYKRMRTRGLMLWIEKDSQKVLTEEQIETRLRDLLFLVNVKKLLVKMKKALVRGYFDSADRIHLKLKRVLKKHKVEDSFGYRKKVLPGDFSVESWRPLFQSLFEEHRTLKQLSAVVDQTAFQEKRDQFLAKLALRQKSYPLFLNAKVVTLWKRDLKRMENKLRLALSFRRKGMSAYRLAKRRGAKDSSGRRTFRKSVELFERYLKQAPKAGDRSRIRLYIRKAKCAATGISHRRCR